MHFCFHEQIWLNECPDEFKPPAYYRRYDDDIFVLLLSPDHLRKFKNYLNSKHRNIRFTCEKEQNNSMTFYLPEPAMVSKHLCITNPHLVGHIQISTVSFRKNIKLVWFSLYYFRRFHLFQIFQDFIQKYVI